MINFKKDNTKKIHKKILDGSLIIDEYTSKWTKNTQKSQYSFCGETIGVILKRSVQSIIRKCWVTYNIEKHLKWAKKMPKNDPEEKATCDILFSFCSCQNNTKMAIQNFIK